LRFSMSVVFFSSFLLFQLVCLQDPFQPNAGLAEAVDLFTLTGSIASPWDQYPGEVTMFSEMGLLSTWGHVTQAPATTAQISQYNCSEGKMSVKTRLFSLACTLADDQRIYIACGEKQY